MSRPRPALIHEADPAIIEAVKWRKPSNRMRGVPVWEHDGIICTGETYKAAVKLTFLPWTGPRCAQSKGKTERQATSL
jgi:hypothetical protein